MVWVNWCFYLSSKNNSEVSAWLDPWHMKKPSPCRLIWLTIAFPPFAYIASSSPHLSSHTCLFSSIVFPATLLSPSGPQHDTARARSWMVHASHSEIPSLWPEETLSLAVRAPPCSWQPGSASRAVWRGGCWAPPASAGRGSCGSEGEIFTSAGAESQARLTGDAHSGAPVAPQQRKSEPWLSSALTQAGVQGDKATHWATWAKHTALDPCAKS